MSRPTQHEPAVTEFIKFVKTRMVELRMNQAELARKTGLSPCGISLILTKGNPPSTNTLIRFAVALNVSPEKLFRLADVLPMEPTINDNNNETWKEMQYYFAKLTPDRQDIAIGLVRSLSAEKTQSSPTELFSQAQLTEINA
jgi:transcriptional regulator with XRE-family HTH domain